MRRFFVLVLFALVVPLYAHHRPGEAHIPLPADISGNLNGCPYRILVPANWNGTLLVYAHASASTELEIVPPTYPPASPTLEEQLLSKGYALAGLFYQSDKEAVVGTVALTASFSGKVGMPHRVIAWGASWGGEVALKLAERYPMFYQGVIATAPGAAGKPREGNFNLRYDTAYAAAFGWPEESWGPLEDVRDDLDPSMVMPVFQWASGENYGLWEFIRLVMHMPSPTWWDMEPLIGLQGYALQGWKATVLRAGMERECGGPVGENVGDVYTLTDAEKTYLSGLGVNADELIARMNANADIKASRSALIRARLSSPRGDLFRPAITMHGMYDPIVPVTEESVYRDLVNAAHRNGFLIQTYVNTPGHISFSAEQYLATLGAMEHWLDTKVRPNDSFFPESVGFDNTFVPQAWPY